MPAHQVLLEALHVGRRLGREEHHLQPARRQLLTNAAEQSREQGVEKVPRAWLWHDDADGFAAPGGETPGRAVGHVAETRGRAFNGAARFLAHPGVAAKTREAVARD